MSRWKSKDADDLQVGYRAQHAAGVVQAESDTAGKRHHVVQSPVDRLYARGSIPAASYSAAQRLYQSWAVCQGARDPEKAGTGAWSPAGYSDAVLSGCQDLRRAMTHLSDAAPLVEWVVIEETTVADLARRLRRDRNRLMADLKAALEALAAWYWPEPSRLPRLQATTLEAGE